MEVSDGWRRGFVEIERWARRKLDFLRRILPFERGIPSHDTLNDVVNALPTETFSECFGAWVAGLRDTDPEIVAIDGNISRRPTTKTRAGYAASSMPWDARTISPRPFATMGADYLLCLKDNWPALRGEVERFFADAGTSPPRARSTA